MKVLIFFLVIISLPQINALSANLSCPEEVIVNKEFECSLLIENNSEVYDVKLDFFGDGKRISKILNNKEWKSTNYYLIGFINNEPKTLNLIINNFSGISEGVIKLRKNGKTSISYQDNISIIVNQDKINDEIEENNEEEIEKEFEENNEEEIEKATIKEDKIENENNTESIIKLNKDEMNKEILYISKNEKIRENIQTIFSIFLIIIIIFLVIRR